MGQKKEKFACPVYMLSGIALGRGSLANGSVVRAWLVLRWPLLQGGLRRRRRRAQAAAEDVAKERVLPDGQSSPSTGGLANSAFVAVCVRNSVDELRQRQMARDEAGGGPASWEQIMVVGPSFSVSRDYGHSTAPRARRRLTLLGSVEAT